MEENTTIEQEQETTQETTQEQETTTQETETQQEIESPSSSETVIEALPDNSENVIHELFYELGVDLDYTPVNGFQCFTMALQFAAALWFIWWLVKTTYQLLRQSIRW